MKKQTFEILPLQGVYWKDRADLTSVLAGVDTDIVGNVAGKVYKETK